MDNQNELLDIVNEKGEVVNTLPRNQIHGNPALMHKVVHALVFNPDGKLILQKRSMNKDAAPGKWDTSVGGHINHNENVQNALEREMHEELGITGCVTKFLYSYIHSNPYETELVYTFICNYSGNLSFNKDEIDEIRAWDIKEIKNNLTDKIFSDNFKQEIQAYFEFISNKANK